MAEQPMVGTRIPSEWKAEIEALAQSQGKKTSQIVYEAIATYLEKTTDNSVIAQPERIEAIEKQLNELSSVISQITALSARVSALEQTSQPRHVVTALSTPEYAREHQDSPPNNQLATEIDESSVEEMPTLKVALLMKCNPTTLTQAAAQGRVPYSCNGWVARPTDRRQKKAIIWQVWRDVS